MDAAPPESLARRQGRPRPSETTLATLRPSWTTVPRHCQTGSCNSGVSNPTRDDRGYGESCSSKDRLTWPARSTCQSVRCEASFLRRCRCTWCSISIFLVTHAIPLRTNLMAFLLHSEQSPVPQSALSQRTCTEHTVSSKPRSKQAKRAHPPQATGIACAKTHLMLAYIKRFERAQGGTHTSCKRERSSVSTVRHTSLPTRRWEPFPGVAHNKAEVAHSPACAFAWGGRSCP
jgi:hypothetical protein